MLLIDGRTVPDENVSFDESTYHWKLLPSGEDITNQIRRRDKERLVTDFDVERENFRLSSELGSTKGDNLGQTPLEDSTGAIFFKQVTTDPLGAPLESLDNAVGKIFKSPGVIVLGIVLIAGLILYKKV